MNYYDKNSNSLQSTPAKNLLIFPDEFIPVYFPLDKRAAGFVAITDDGETVTSCEWNEEAYQKWCAENPEPDYLAEAKSKKEAELSAACNSEIVAGMIDMVREDYKYHLTCKPGVQKVIQELSEKRIPLYFIVGIRRIRIRAHCPYAGHRKLSVEAAQRGRAYRLDTKISG